MTTVGGIEDVDDKENSVDLESLARFAVDEHNKKENAMLQYKKVLKAKHQVVAGTMYYITLEVMDGDATKVYEAKIWEKPWMNFKELEEFKPVDASSATSA